MRPTDPPPITTILIANMLSAEVLRVRPSNKGDEMAIVYKVRPATVDDIDILIKMNQELFQYEYDYGFTDTWDINWPASEEGRKWYQAIFDTELSGAWIALNDLNEPVGSLVARVETDPMRTLNPIATIDFIYINEGYRCSGVGRTLVEDVKNWCSSKDVKLIETGAMVSNEHARKFYEKWGFSETEVQYGIKL